MNNKQMFSSLVKVMAIAAVTIPTVLMQAQSSQAIPLDDILDSAGKSFVQNLFGRPDKPKETEQKTDTDPAGNTTDTHAQEPDKTTDGDSPDR
jgi:hypothetical protein